jgi:hypothetical protein
MPVTEEDIDPLAGVANLFDVSVVFIVGLIVALFGTFKLKDLVDPNSEVTVMRKNAKGEIRIMVKKGRKLESYKVGAEEGEGTGKRLGTAYQLDDGQMIYVPEEVVRGTP